MGRAQSKFSDTETVLQSIQLDIMMDRKEVENWIGSFRTEYPQGYMDRSDFRRMYKSYFPFGDSAPFADLVFQLFDQDNDGRVGCREFLVAMDKLTRRPLHERLEFIFQLYDLNRDGFIAKEEMLYIVTCMYEMSAGMMAKNKLPDDEQTPEQRVDKIFRLMDSDGDGQLSLAEFCEGAKQDPSILQILSAFDKPANQQTSSR